MFNFHLKLRRTRDLSESRHKPAKIINSGEIVIFLAAKMSMAKLQNSGEIVDFNGENVIILAAKSRILTAKTWIIENLSAKSYFTNFINSTVQDSCQESLIG